MTSPFCFAEDKYLTNLYVRTVSVVALPDNMFKVTLSRDSLMDGPMELTLPTQLAMKFLPLGKNIDLYMFS